MIHTSDLSKETPQDPYISCTLCPRRCGVDRTDAQRGYCHADDRMRIARAALHYWEEPCISGTRGSGAVFFSGCNLGCVFCQNYKISHTRGNIPEGQTVTAEELSEIFFRLKDEGAHNINLVTPDIYLPSVAEAIALAKKQNFPLPFIWNSSSYLNTESLHRLDGLIDVYLPDYKFYSSKTAKEYANAADYPQAAADAIAEMVRQCATHSDNRKNLPLKGGCVFDENGMIRSGVIVRHLLMPGGLLEAKRILKLLWDTYNDGICLSLLHQYTPLMPQLSAYPKLQYRVSEREYDELIRYALQLGISHAYMQEGDAASESYIPEFL